jgi:hypothetical protein
VKLQYLQIPREQVRKAVLASKDEYAWEVEANKYYQRHQNEFPSTQPAATRATTQDAFSLGSTPASPVSAATTQPFEDVREQVMEKILVEPVAKLQRQIQNEITAKLAQAFEQHGKSAATTGNATTGPTTAPTEGPTGFTSFEFLQNLARDVEQRYQVTLTVAAIQDSFKSEKELEALPGIGQAEPFAQYAITAAEPFVPPAEKDKPMVLSLFEPSKPIVDESQNVYVFRITAADPAHKPASLDEVRQQVEQDKRKAQAMELAKSAATKLLEAARAKGLADAVASGAAGDRKLVMTGFYTIGSPGGIPAYNLSADAQATFIRGTYDVVGVLTKNDGTRPLALVELPADSKVSVAEVIAVEQMLTPLDLQNQIAPELRRGYMQFMLRDWFDFDAVVARLGYVDQTGRHQPPVQPPPQPAAQPEQAAAR